MTKLYSLHLDTGAPLLAQTSWARFIPVEMSVSGAARFSGVAMTASLGLGEVHDAPYDPAVLELPDHERRPAILDWLQDHLLQLAASLDWDTGPLEAAYQACLRDGCRFRQTGAPKASADRRYRAHVEFEIDGEGDGWSWVEVKDPAGAVILRSERRDSPASITASGRVRRSVRWQGAEVTWMPWVDDIAPKGYEEWVGHVERLALEDGKLPGATA
ncbi:hypothetical protein [Paractinoplanes durhamensis]|uniref:hypothetical protein n=1 Tax=Paractinoplanes durhamensis TaxID=113563 RepID=UPI00194496CC|nr:hypothetical protein [Actinoplanes durhamensis]